jgi:hypothetical protein
VKFAGGDRGGVDAHPDFTRARFRHGHLLEDHVVAVARSVESNGFHRFNFVYRVHEVSDVAPSVASHPSEVNAATRMATRTANRKRVAWLFGPPYALKP